MKLLAHVMTPQSLSENQRFSVFSGGIERDQWHEMDELKTTKYKVKTNNISRPNNYKKPLPVFLSIF